MAEQLIATGVTVIGVDMYMDRLSELANAHKDMFRPVTAGLSPQDGVATCCQQILSAHGAVDILINNAGIITLSKFLETSLDALRHAMTVNFQSAYLMCQNLVPSMVARRSGRITNMSSFAGRSGGLLAGTACSLSKTALIGLTISLDREFGPKGLSVNALAPAFVKSDTMASAFASPEDEARLIAAIPAQRLGTPAEVTSAAVYLASAPAGLINGEVIDIKYGIQCDLSGSAVYFKDLGRGFHSIVQHMICPPQMLGHRVKRRLGASRTDCIRHILVLRQNGFCFALGPHDIAKPVHVELGPLHFGPNIFQPTPSGNGRMKRLVRGKESRLIPDVGVHFLQLDFALQGLAERGVVFQFGRASHQRQFKRLPHELRTSKGGDPDRRNRRPTLRDDVEKSQRLKLLERFAHRRPAHPKVLGELRLGQMGARFELKLEDHAEDDLEHLIGHRLARQPLAQALIHTWPLTGLHRDLSKMVEDQALLKMSAY